MQGRSKNELHWLYNTRTDERDDALPLIFEYGSLRFFFAGTGRRNSEQLILYVEIPKKLAGGEKACQLLGAQKADCTLPYENYLLRLLSPMLKDLCSAYRNGDKNAREKAQFYAQQAGVTVVRRSGIRYEEEKSAFVFAIHFQVPLVNALSVNAKSAFRAVRDVLEHIEKALLAMDYNELREWVAVWNRQQEIRAFMKANGLCAFVADGSVLPRENGSDQPMKQALPFAAPKELAVEIPLSDGMKLRGMGIYGGVTVITGGGYSGKSTLLDALEMGIYDHIPGDGREYVLTDVSAVKIGAEDGRPVFDVDISPFFRSLPGGADCRDFSTLHASGSVSQAAGILEAVCGGTKLLLIDEDKSAVNFMIRDETMRLVVKKEPIIPFTDRVRELYAQRGISTILVIGGSGEFLSRADDVICMDDYVPKDITQELREQKLLQRAGKETMQEAVWPASRRVIPRKTIQPFLYFQSVETENARKLILDEYSADISNLTALVSKEQVGTLLRVMEKLLTDTEADEKELIEKVEEYIKRILERNEGDFCSLMPEATQQFYEEIRPLDAFLCANRMRGLRFHRPGEW